MLSGAGLQFILDACVLDRSVLIDCVSEDDIECAGGCVEVVV